MSNKYILCPHCSNLIRENDEVCEKCNRRIFSGLSEEEKTLKEKKASVFQKYGMIKKAHLIGCILIILIGFIVLFTEFPATFEIPATIVLAILAAIIIALGVLKGRLRKQVFKNEHQTIRK